MNQKEGLKNLLENTLSSSQKIKTSLNGEIISLQINDTVGKAIETLSKNNISSIPIYDQGKCQGLVDMFDIIAYLITIFPEHASRNFVQKGMKLDEPLHKVINKSKMNPHLPITMDSPILFLAELFAGGLHRLPIMDKLDGKVIYILTQSSVIDFLANNIEKIEPEITNKTLEELEIDKKDVLTVSKNKPTIDVLGLLVDLKYTAVAVVDDDGTPLSNFSGNDLKGITSSNISKLLEPIGKFKPEKNIQTCTSKTTLGEVISTVSKNHIHRLWVVNENNQIMGLVSLTDILNRLIWLIK